jgi:hypothetical protein
MKPWQTSLNKAPRKEKGEKTRKNLFEERNLCEVLVIKML